MASTTTLQNLYDLSYAILREEQNDVSAYPTTLLKPFLNVAELSFCSWNIINPVPISPDLKDAKKGQLPFLWTDYFYSNVAPTYLTAVTTVWATTLSATTTGYSATGKLYLNGNIITYTGVTSTTFTWVTGVLFAHESGTQVSPVFTLPTDYMSMRNVVYNNVGKLEWMLYDDVRETLNSNKWYNTPLDQTNSTTNNSTYYSKPFYTIKNSTQLILWNLSNTGWQIRLRYDKIPTAMSATTDLTTIDNDQFAQMILPYLAVAELLYSRGEEDRASKLYNHAVWRAKRAYTYYNNQSFEDISGVRVSSDKSGRRLNI